MPDRAPLCWICKRERATTGEHLSKRSDINDLLGDGGPLYLHTDQRRNHILQSSNAKRLKFEKSLCNGCNSARTQPHDLAWQKMSATLRQRKPALKTGDTIRANRIFRYETSVEMLNMHLFFVKWIGCQIFESSIPIEPPIETLSQAIMDGKSHPNIWLAFGVEHRFADWLSVSTLDCRWSSSGANCEHLCRIYVVGALRVRVRFSSAKQNDDWHPHLGDVFVIADLVGPDIKEAG